MATGDVLLAGRALAAFRGGEDTPLARAGSMLEAAYMLKSLKTPAR
jgi:hypothetical protein